MHFRREVIRVVEQANGHIDRIWQVLITSGERAAAVRAECARDTFYKADPLAFARCERNGVFVEGGKGCHWRTRGAFAICTMAKGNCLGRSRRLKSCPAAIASPGAHRHSE